MARFTQGGSGGTGGNANTGDITFNGVQIIGAGNASSDGLNAGTMQLVPDANLSTDQYLIIDPTSPNHIHIRAGGTLDGSSADLIMGGERTMVLVSDPGEFVDIRTTSSENYTHVWRFGADGILSGPAMGSVGVGGLYNNPGNDLYIGSADAVVITGTDGEFLNDSSIPGNQIIVRSDLDSAVASINDTGWTNASLVNSFVSGGTAPAYRKLNNVVYLRGNMHQGTSNATAFTLPSGYRPSATSVILTQKFGTSTTTYVTINTDGTVVPQDSASWLSGIIFPIG